MQKAKKYAIGIVLFAVLLTIAFFNNPFIIKAQEGDVVSVFYTGTLQNGTVFDSNIKEIAQRNDLTKASYDPLVFTIGSGQTIKGFDRAIKGMRPGQTKTVKIKPKDAYGEYADNNTIDIDRRKIIPRDITLEREQTISTSQYTQEYGKEPVIGSTTTSESNTLATTVLSMAEDDVTIRIDASIGDVVMVPDVAWPNTVKSITENEIVIRQQPPEDKDIISSLGPVEVIVFPDFIHMVLRAEVGDEIDTPAGPVRIKEVEGYLVTVDLNHPLAGKTLEFEITLEEIR